jgi:hypothetical protein
MEKIFIDHNLLFFIIPLTPPFIKGDKGGLKEKRKISIAYA